MTIQAGTWRAKATGAELGYTSTGKEQVAMSIEILDGPSANHIITWYGYFTEKTTDRSLESLMIAGWDGEDLAAMTGVGSTEFQVVIEEDTYEGKTRMRVQWINRLFGSGPALKNKMDTGAKVSFAERMKGRALAVKQGLPKPPVDEDDDFPGF